MFSTDSQQNSSIEICSKTYFILMPKWLPSFDIQTSLIYTLQTELLGRSESSHLEFCSLLKEKMEKEYLCRDNRISYQDNGTGVPHVVRKGAFTPHPEPKLHGQGCTTWKGQWNNQIAAHCTWCHGQWKEFQTFDLILWKFWAIENVGERWATSCPRHVSLEPSPNV